MIAIAGSIESCDCLITLFKSDSLEIDLKSDVIIQYGDAIKKVILNVLETNNIKDVKVVVDDKGALDYTLTARLLTALKRGELI